MDGDVSFRQHSAGHTSGPNWPVFLTFAERYFTATATTTSRVAQYATAEPISAGKSHTLVGMRNVVSFVLLAFVASSRCGRLA